MADAPLLVDVDNQLQPAPEQADVTLMFERLVRDPAANVENVERLMALWERAEARKAERAFNVAMSACQGEMRAVSADAYNPQTRSKYASYEKLDAALRPIYTRHGLGVSFPGTGDSDLPEHVRVLCKVTHVGGHVEHYHIDMPADGKGAKGGDVMTKTHAVGSAVTYGMRYLLKMVFNVAIGEDDDDGNRAGSRDDAQPDPPNGYDAWVAVLEKEAEAGFAAFDAAWAAKGSKPEFKNYMVKWNRAGYNALKTTAGKKK